MEKLIELLNEHRKEMNGDGKWYIDTDNYNMLTLNNLDKLSSELWVISKEYGFIKWLVEKDKIDYHNKINYDISLAINRVLKKTTREERLLMMLAIQDEPIEFLISVLK